MGHRRTVSAGYVMARKMKTKRVIVNKPGVLSSCLQCDVMVYFDLIETQDMVDGIPDLAYSFGNLRFGDEATPSVSCYACARTLLQLAGGGISTTIMLSGPNAFTVVGVINEMQGSETDLAA